MINFSTNLQSSNPAYLKEYFPNSKGSRIFLRVPLSHKLLLVSTEPNRKFELVLKMKQCRRSRGALLGTENFAFGWAQSWLPAPAQRSPLPWPCLICSVQTPPTPNTVHISVITLTTFYKGVFLQSSLPPD